MLSHKNILFTTRAVVDTFQLDYFDSSIVFLPLSNITEQLFSIYMPACTGASIFLSAGVNTLFRDMIEVTTAVIRTFFYEKKVKNTFFLL